MSLSLDEVSLHMYYIIVFSLMLRRVVEEDDFLLIGCEPACSAL